MVRMMTASRTRPPHPASPPSPPAKNAGGEGARLGSVARKFTKELLAADVPNQTSSAFSPTVFVGEKVAEGRMRGHSGARLWRGAGKLARSLSLLLIAIASIAMSDYDTDLARL